MTVKYQLSEVGTFAGVHIDLLMIEHKVSLYVSDYSLRFHTTSIDPEDIRKGIRAARAGCTDLTCKCSFFGAFSEDRIDFYCSGMSFSIEKASRGTFIDAMEKALDDVEAQYAQAA